MSSSFLRIGFVGRLSGRERKILGAGLLAAVLFSGLYFFVFPIHDKVKQYPDQINQKTRLLQRYKEVIAQRQMQEQSLETTRKRIAELEGHLLTSRTTAAAQAQLQGLVNDLAKQSQLQINRSDFLPKKELSKDYEKISIRLDAVGTVNQVTAFLTAAKEMPMFVLNDDLRLWSYSSLSEGWKKTKQIAATIVVSGVIRHE
ncbi:MAG: type II secretion system protein GspM [Terriglobia bacterium]